MVPLLVGLLRLVAAQEEEDHLSYEGTDVHILTSDNFEESVFGGEDVWMVEFYAPWCGHCKRLAPEWVKAAGELQGKVKLGAVDATAFPDLAGAFEVQGYPTVKVFKFRDEPPRNYDGPREAEGIVAFTLNEIWDGNLPPYQAVEITGQAVFDDLCGETLCLVVVLPDILDTQAAGRQKLLEDINNVARKRRRERYPIRFAWTSAMAYPEFEDALQLGGTGYPQVTAINVKKQSFIRMLSAFSQENLHDFINYNMGYMDTRSYPAEKNAIRGQLAFADRAPWDGKDGELVAEEEFDLAELGIEVEKEL